MIQYLEGELLRADINDVVILASGVGYRVFATSETIEDLKKSAKKGSVSVYTHLAVRENSMDLYGFSKSEEMRFFELLLSVSGIGPKSALSILNIAPIETLKEAVVSNDSSYLTKVSGIGTKSAQKIVIELQGKIGAIGEGSVSVRKEDMDVFEALKALGYSSNEIRESIKEMPADVDGTKARIKEALKFLGK
jgi:Holliday junction DNA helicase RuvA